MVASSYYLPNLRVYGPGAAQPPKFIFVGLDTSSKSKHHRFIILATLATIAFAVHVCSPWIIATSNALNSIGTVVAAVGGSLSMTNRLIGGVGTGIGDVWCMTIGTNGCGAPLPRQAAVYDAEKMDPSGGLGLGMPLVDDLKLLGVAQVHHGASQRYAKHSNAPSRAHFHGCQYLEYRHEPSPNSSSLPFLQALGRHLGEAGTTVPSVARTPSPVLRVYYRDVRGHSAPCELQASYNKLCRSRARPGSTSSIAILCSSLVFATLPTSMAR